jgi:hypothetical protein
MPSGAVSGLWAAGVWSSTFWEAGFWASDAPAAATPDVEVNVRPRQELSDGDLFIKDPVDKPVIGFNFGDEIDEGAGIASATWTIAAVRPSADTALLKDNEALTVGSRRAQTRITAGTLGAVYRLCCTVVTDETPAQTLRRSIFVKVEPR